MSRSIYFARCAAFVAAAVLVAAPAFAQTSALATIALNGTEAASVTLGAASPTTQSVTLTNGSQNPFSSAFSITANWNVASSTSTTVKLVAYFTTANAAFTDGNGHNIPSSLIEVSINGGTTWNPMTAGAVGSVGTGGASYVLFTSPVTNGPAAAGTQPVSFMLRVNLTSNPTLPPATYTATLNLMAVSS